jgi:DNA-binding CsgD family transcriptional regulator
MLTERELEIYEMLTLEKLKRNVVELKISPNTIKVHKGNIYRKLASKGKTKTIKRYIKKEL